MTATVNKLEALRKSLAELEARFGSGNPMVQGLRMQIALAERNAARWWADPFFGDMPCGEGSASGPKLVGRFKRHR